MIVQPHPLTTMTLTLIHYVIILLSLENGQLFDGSINDGWMDGWIDGWMDGWMNGYMDRQIVNVLSLSKVMDHIFVSVTLSSFCSSISF